MTEQEFIYMACCYAISELMRKGSYKFAIKVDGKWIVEDWELIVKELDDILNRKEEHNNDRTVHESNLQIAKVDTSQ